MVQTTRQLQSYTRRLTRKGERERLRASYDIIEAGVLPEDVSGLALASLVVVSDSFRDNVKLLTSHYRRGNADPLEIVGAEIETNLLDIYELIQVFFRERGKDLPSLLEERQDEEGSFVLDSRIVSVREVRRL